MENNLISFAISAEIYTHNPLYVSILYSDVPSLFTTNTKSTYDPMYEEINPYILYIIWLSWFLNYEALTII